MGDELNDGENRLLDTMRRLVEKGKIEIRDNGIILAGEEGVGKPRACVAFSGH